MTRISLAIATIFFAHYAVAFTWISLNNKPIRLRSSTSCARAADHEQRAVCDCCIIQNADVDKYNAAEAAIRCYEEHTCRFDEAAYSDLTVAKQELQAARKRLKAMTIVDVDALKEPPKLPENDVLQNDDVINIMEALNTAGHLSLPAELLDKSGKSSMKLFAKPLGDNAKGVYSGQLFFVGYTKTIIDKKGLSKDKTIPLYILKETKKGKSEIRHLYAMDVSRLENERVNTFDKHFGEVAQSSSTIAKIAFDDLHFTIKTKGATRFFSLLQTAQGKSLNKHLRDFGKLAQTLETDDKEFQLALRRIKHIFYRIGFAMSELHQKYADPTDKRNKPLKRTFTHGDLHSENIFYDDDTDTVTLIDNETFALSLKHPSLGVDDIVEFYMMHTLKTIAHTVASQLTNNREFGIHDGLWHELWRSLFDGYLSAYGVLTRMEFEALFKDFKNQFYNGLSQFRIFKSPRNFADQRKLKRFGPSVRRGKLKAHELADTFDRLYVKKIEGFEKMRSSHMGNF